MSDTNYDWASREIERLRAELHDAHVERHEAESRECTLKGELASANALLVRCVPGMPDQPSADEILAHLAEQPAVANALTHEEIERLRADNARLRAGTNANAHSLAAANALLDEWLTIDAAASNTPSRFLDRVHAHLTGQPAAPAHCPGCATEQGGDCPECLRTADDVRCQHYSLAELRRIYNAPQGELTSAELVVLDALLEFTK